MSLLCGEKTIENIRDYSVILALVSSGSTHADFIIHLVSV